MMVEETQGREPLWFPLMYDKEQKDELSTRDLGTAAPLRDHDSER